MKKILFVLMIVMLSAGMAWGGMERPVNTGTFVGYYTGSGEMCVQTESGEEIVLTGILRRCLEFIEDEQAKLDRMKRETQLARDIKKVLEGLSNDDSD